MIIHGIPVNTQHRWSTLKKLMWYRLHDSGGSLPWSTFTGNPVEFNAPKAHVLKSLKASFSPIQDLHGYANPWPPGGGVNKFNPDSIQTGTYSGTTWTITTPSTTDPVLDFTFEANTQYTFSGISTQALASKNLRIQIVYTDSSVTNLWASNATDPVTFAVTSTAGKSIDHLAFNFGAAGGSVTVDKFQIEVGTTASAYSPYSNICPISGRTGANVYDTGSNVLPNDFEDGSLNNANGNPVGNNNYKRSVNYVPISPNTKYYIKADSGIFIKYFDENKTAVSSSWDVSNQHDAEITTNSKARYLKVVFPVAMDTGSFSINYPSTDTEYHAYNPASWKQSVTWTDEGTVYGGYLTVAEDGSCDLTTTITAPTITGNDLNLAANMQPEGNLWRLTIATALPEAVSNYADAICNSYKVVKSYSAVNSTNGSIGLNASTMGQILLHNDAFTTRQEIIDGLNATPIQLAYELATPIVTHLDSVQQLQALVGINTMWSDTNGDLTVEARAESVQLNALQSLNMLLGGRYMNNHTEDDLSDEEALDVILGK